MLLVLVLLALVAMCIMYIRLVELSHLHSDLCARALARNDTVNHFYFPFSSGAEFASASTATLCNPQPTPSSVSFS